MGLQEIIEDHKVNLKKERKQKEVRRQGERRRQNERQRLCAAESRHYLQKAQAHFAEIRAGQKVLYRSFAGPNARCCPASISCF